MISSSIFRTLAIDDMQQPSPQHGLSLRADVNHAALPVAGQLMLDESNLQYVAQAVGFRNS